MINKKIKAYLKKFPFIWKRIVSFYNFILELSRWKDVFMMMILFNLWPEQTYKFSTRKVLPSKKNRFFKEEKPTIPFKLIESKNHNITKMKEINVLSHGSSFNLNDINKLKGPIFLVSYGAPLAKDENNNIIYSTEEFLKQENIFHESRAWGHSFGTLDGSKKGNREKPKNLTEIKNENFIYTHSIEKIIRGFIKRGHKVLIPEAYTVGKKGDYIPNDPGYSKSSYLNLYKSDHVSGVAVVDMIFKPTFSNNETANLMPTSSGWLYSDSSPSGSYPSGSFVKTLCALSYFAEKINVYGWDMLLDTSPEKMNYWQLLFNMYKYKADRGRSRWNFEEALINFYYGYKFSQLPNFKIYGHMGKLNKHSKLINRIERVLFN